MAGKEFDLSEGEIILASGQTDNSKLARHCFLQAVLVICFFTFIFGPLFLVGFMVRGSVLDRGLATTAFLFAAALGLLVGSIFPVMQYLNQKSLTWMITNHRIVHDKGLNLPISRVKKVGAYGVMLDEMTDAGIPGVRGRLLRKRIMKYVQAARDAELENPDDRFPALPQPDLSLP